MTPNDQNGTSKKRDFFRKAGKIIIGYLLFGIVIAALFFLLFRIRADTIMIAIQLGKNKVQVTGISNYAITISGIIMFLGLIFGEDRLRNSFEQNQMWKLILKMFIITASVWVVWLVVSYLMMWRALS